MRKSAACTTSLSSSCVYRSLDINPSSRLLAHELQWERSSILQISRFVVQLHVAVNASSPQSYSPCYVAGSAGQYALWRSRMHACQSISHLIAVSSKVLPRSANDIIQQPLLLGTKLLCALRSQSSIIAPGMTRYYSLLPILRDCHVRTSVSYQQPLKPTAPLYQDPHQIASNLAISRQCLGAQDLQVHSPHRCVCTSLQKKRFSRQPYPFAHKSQINLNINA
jgi:hypothetical protein